MPEILRTNSSNPHFIQLVAALDADLAIRDGDDHAFYAQFNKTATLHYCILAYENNEPAGSGALREFGAGIMEVKRMYVPPAHRGKGIASAVLKALENWAKELGYRKCILETGKNQPEAITMYKNRGYSIIPNYGQYQTVENSVCFEKLL